MKIEKLLRINHPMVLNDWLMQSTEKQTLSFQHDQTAELEPLTIQSEGVLIYHVHSPLNHIQLLEGLLSVLFPIVVWPFQHSVYHMTFEAPTSCICVNYTQNEETISVPHSSILNVLPSTLDLMISICLGYHGNIIMH